MFTLLNSCTALMALATVLYGYAVAGEVVKTQGTTIETTSAALRPGDPGTAVGPPGHDIKHAARLPETGAATPTGIRLVTDSPFAGLQTASTIDANFERQTLELRGIMSDSEGTKYCIYDTLKGRGIWIGLQEKGYPFVVTWADPARDKVRIQTETGKEQSLELRSAKVSSGVASAAHVGVPAVGGAKADSAERTTEREAALERLAEIRADAERRRLELESKLNSEGPQTANPQP